MKWCYWHGLLKILCIFSFQEKPFLTEENVATDMEDMTQDNDLWVSGRRHRERLLKAVFFLCCQPTPSGHVPSLPAALVAQLVEHSCLESRESWVQTQGSSFFFEKGLLWVC